MGPGQSRGNQALGGESRLLGSQTHPTRTSCPISSAMRPKIASFLLPCSTICGYQATWGSIWETRENDSPPEPSTSGLTWDSCPAPRRDPSPHTQPAEVPLKNTTKSL